MILIRFSDAESTHDGWPKVNSSPTPVSTSPMGRLAFESVLSSKTRDGEHDNIRADSSRAGDQWCGSNSA